MSLLLTKDPAHEQPGQPAPGPAGDGPPAQSDGAAPPGYGTVPPWVISPDTARLIDFAKAAFGAQELARLPGPDGGIGHAEIRMGRARRS